MVCIAVGTPLIAWSQDEVSLVDKPAYLAPKVTRSLILAGTDTAERTILVGEHGHVLTSDDQGATWRQAPTPTRSMLVDVFFVDATHGFAVGHDAVVLKTTDGGDSWTKVHFDPALQQPLFSVWFADRNRGIAVGAYGLYLETDDGGETWERRVFLSEQLAGTEDEDEDDAFIDPEFGEDYHLNHIVASDDGRLYMAAEAGRFYRSDDQGETWFSIPTPYAGSYYRTLPLDGDALLILGMRGNVYFSPDAGENWEQVRIATQSLLSEAVVLADGRVVLAGMAGALLVGAVDGLEFKLHQQADRKGIGALIPIGGARLIIAGEGGVSVRDESKYMTGK